MRHGIVLPGGTASEQLDLAVVAEQSGWDGVFVWEAAYGVDAWVVPQFETSGGKARPDEVRALRAGLAERGARPDLDVIADGETPTDDRAAAAAHVAPWAEAGCTWWLETRWEMPHHSAERRDEVRRRLAAGPPAG